MLRRFEFIVAMFATVVTFAGLGIAESVASDSNDAQWISVEEPPKPNQWICFRKQIQLDHVPDSLVATIAVDSKYWLWINEELIVFEGQLKRGPTRSSTYADQVELASHLRTGTNTIAILVWYFGKQGFSHHDSGQSGLFFDAASAVFSLHSDRTWKARLHPAYGNTDEPHPNFRLPESNIRFDARQTGDGETVLEDWWQDDFDDSSWAEAKQMGGESSAPWGDLVLRPIPMWRDSGLQSYVNDDKLELPRVSAGEVFEAKLPHNAQVTPYLKVQSEAGQIIDIRTDNYRGGGPPNVRAEYITREGKQAYENLGWMNGHTVRYTIPAGVAVLELKYRETGFDTDFTGTFECDDPTLMKLRQKALRTLYVTMRDTYFDCPDRERAQWWGDAVLELGEAFYAMDVRSSLLAKKGILELIGWQRDDNTIYSPVPSGNYDAELPMQMLASVGHYGFATYALHSGDIETIRTVYPGVARYLSVWNQDDDGLVVPRQGGWTWGDWGENKDMPLLYSGWYALALQGQAEMARMIGRDQDVPPLQHKLARLKATFNQRYWSGSQYRSPDYQGMTDDRAHALAVVAGLADADKYDAITEVLRRQRHSSPYMEKYVMESLYRMQRPALAIERCKQRYAKMIEHPTTTLWEGWGICAEGFGGGTINHAWSGGPLTIMSQFMAGIEPTEPGYKRFRVRPQLGPLQFVEATVDSAAGPISATIRQTDTNWKMTVTVPEGATADLGVPVEGCETMTLDENIVWRKDDATTTTAVRDGFVYFETASGKHVVEASRR